MKVILKIPFVVFLFIFNDVNSQILTLKDAIKISQSNSLDYKIAQNQALSSYWQYQSFNASLLPKLSLGGTLPDYYRTINSITLPNGQNSFIRQNVSNARTNLNISQNVALTGGVVSITSSLSRIDNFGNNRRLDYNSAPLSINYSQGNLFYNDFKWRKKIEPLRLSESQKLYSESVETLASNTVSRFFALLLKSTQLKLDQQNLKNLDTLLKITESRFAIGTVQLDHVLQLKIALLNASQSVSNSTLLVEAAKQGLIKYLNFKKEVILDLAIPDSLIFFEVVPEVAFAKAKENRKFPIEFRRRIIEAEQAVKRTRAETGPALSLRSNLGLTQRGSSLSIAYDELLRNESIAVSIAVPLMDWGVNKFNRKRAEANLELERNTIEQQQLAIEQEINYQVMKWSIQEDQMRMAKLTLELAQKRYEISMQKFSSGVINFNDFNIAQLDKDRSVVNYISNLENYWLSFYTIRRITLYDFNLNRSIAELN